MVHRIAGLALLGLALAACSADRTTGPATVSPDVDASALNAAGGGRAGGHAEFVASGIQSRYTFTSITTVPPAAKGRFQLHRWFPDGRMLVMKGTVECMTIEPRPNGGLARMAGRVESLRVDNNDVIVPEHLDRAIWTVVDNGEGEDSPPDLASGLLNFRTAADAAAHCAVGLIRFGFFSQDGNIQVQPD